MLALAQGQWEKVAKPIKAPSGLDTKEKTAKQDSIKSKKKTVLRRGRL